MKVHPIGDRILIQPIKQEETTKSGIVLPVGSEKEKKSQGKIVAVGNGEAIQKLGLKEGDTIVYGQFSGSEVEVDGEELRILYVGKDEDRNEVLATINE
jgi:chaperonin GroES